jgi:hypothetical protein
MADKEYAPLICKEVSTQFGPKMMISGKAREIADWVMSHQNSQGYINIEISKRRTPKNGVTHYATLNTWAPKGGGGQQHSAPQRREQQPDNDYQNPEPPADGGDNVPY